MRRLRRIWLTVVLLSVLLATGLAQACNPYDGPNAYADEAFSAYQLLLSRYVQPPDGAAVLNGGWSAARDLVVKNTIPPATAAPAVDDAKPTEASFETLFLRLLRSAHHKVKAQDLEQSLIIGMTRSLKDDHTNFLPPNEWQQVLSGNATRTGFRSVADPRGALVREVLPASPASIAGLKPGDIIGAIDGHSTRPGSPASTPPKPGVEVELIVARPKVGSLTLHLTPVTAQRDIVSARLLSGQIAYVRIYSFLVRPSVAGAPAAGGLSELDEALKSLSLQKPIGWIIDLRNDSGGSIVAASRVAGELGFGGAFVEAVGRSGELPPLSALDFDVTSRAPIVVITNRSSASSSELLAANLQSSGRAHVVGDRTAGSVKSSVFFPVGGAALQITTAYIFAGEGRIALDGVGVLPDELVSLDSAALAAGHDAQLEAAIAYIRAHPR